jgi:hypothetical protein
MEGNRRWLGWIGIALGALALLVALGGRGFASQAAPGGQNRPNQSQSYAQPGLGPQGSGRQAGPAAPGPNAQPGPGQPGARPPSDAGRHGSDTRPGPGRPGDAGFGLGGWLRFPFRAIGGVFQTGMLALLIILGVWLIRGRSGGSVGGRRTEPAQAPAQPPPAEESYTDEPSEPE